nr:hypothetical protein [Providencia rettgeri]ELR5233699.1 hypothetical protein [Providencia rettgeri]
MDNLQQRLNHYQRQVQEGELNVVYEYLIKTLMQTKQYLVRQPERGFEYGNVAPGYLDYSYFPIVNNFLKKRKLRFGIVLNHQKLCLELWLMGQNVTIQKAYWQKLQHSQWNKHLTQMPQYSVLASELISHPDFTQKNALFIEIEKQLFPLMDEVMCFIEKIEK